jgi:DNA-binding NtrC family response regulator
MAQRVVVVEDEILMRSALAREFRGAFDVVLVGTSEQAQAAIIDTTLVAVATDYLLGRGGDGIALLAEVRARRPDVVRCLITGLPRSEPITVALEDGVVVEKPWPTGSLMTSSSAASQGRVGK